VAPDTVGNAEWPSVATSKLTATAWPTTAYLAAGYPIASGVIEGACRHAVNNRMERSDMRWMLPGAHAMLGVRSIHLIGL
jgi:hypothetical protein